MSVQPEFDGPQARRESAWTRFKKRWNRKGVVEVDVDHRRYDMLNSMREGIRDVVLYHPEYTKPSLVPADYSDVHVYTSTTAKRFRFTSYASAIFIRIREAIGLSDEDYVNSIAPEDLPYLEFISNSKSGQDFFISNDKQLFMKTDKQHCLNIFRSFLGDYLNHFEKYPHSLIVKILGLYSIQTSGGKQINFMVMQSIFCPDTRIEDRYDIKGCYAGRYQKPSDNEKIITILKDQNFRDLYIDLGAERDWFLKQLACDANFMAEMGVQDYSLLVGRQTLLDEEKKRHFADVTLGMAKSLKIGHNSPNDFSERSPELESISELNQSDTRTVEFPFSEIPESTPHGSRLTHRFSFYEPNIHAQNLRLLPNSKKNALHIVTGTTHYYFLGIIDFLTLYECRQRSGRVLKNIKHCCSDHSTVPPLRYAKRFVDFFHNHSK